MPGAVGYPSLFMLGALVFCGGYDGGSCAVAMFVCGGVYDKKINDEMRLLWIRMSGACQPDTIVALSIDFNAAVTQFGIT